MQPLAGMTVLLLSSMEAYVTQCSLYPQIPPTHKPPSDATVYNSPALHNEGNAAWICVGLLMDALGFL